MPPHGAPPPRAAAEHQLDTDLAAGIRSESTPHAKRGLHQGDGANFFGNSGNTNVVTFSNGHKWVRKQDIPDAEFKNEVLTSQVSDAIGAGAPVAITRPGGDGDAGGDGGTELWEPFLKGTKSAIEWEGGHDDFDDPIDNDPQEMYDTPAGVRIGILDNLVENRDRHEGNWMVAHDRKSGQDSPLPIDHGRVTFGDTAEYGSGPFGENVYQSPWALADVPQQQWDTWRANLAGLADSFGAAGKGAGYQQMMRNFGAMESVAAGGRLLQQQGSKP